ncbi:hypothetical protein VQ309_004773 [Salmonella enterica]|nr:hypothetical protein [Salmonella enterica]EMD4801611.1 hypothetical protein [Salmonella enterica]
MSGINGRAVSGFKQQITVKQQTSIFLIGEIKAPLSSRSIEINTIPCRDTGITDFRTGITPLRINAYVITCKKRNVTDTHRLNIRG